MIAHIHGEITEKMLNKIIIDVAGVGYEIFTSTTDNQAVNVGERQKFYTYYHVREQSQELFGFLQSNAKAIFELLITVQGVGPKAALAILSLGDIESVRNAIANSDSAFIQQASGVGKKTAERVVVDLSDKVGLPTYYGRKDTIIQSELKANDEALEALMALGYNLADATKALDGVDLDLPTSQRVKQALKN